MGTWGPKSFENDEALDWVSTVESADDLRKPLLQAIEELFAIHDSNPNFDFRRGSGDPQTNARKAQKLIETCLIMLAMNDHLGYCNKTRDQLLAELYARKGACAYWFNRYRTAMENYKTAIKLDAERESEWLSPFLIIAAKEFYNDEKYRESLEAFNYVIESGCSPDFNQIQVAETSPALYVMPDMTSWSCKAYAYLFSGLCKFSLGDNEGLKRDVEHAVSTDPLIEANILAGLLLDFEFSYDKTYTIIDAVLSVQPDNTYFKCLRELLSAYHNFNEQTAQTALSNYENLDAEGIAKRSVDKGTLSVAAELVRSKLK